MDDSEYQKPKSRLIKSIEEDIARRQTYVGSGDRAKIMCDSKWGNSYTVWQDKVDPLEVVIARQVETPQMIRGKVLEPVVLNEYDRLHGLKVRRLSHPGGTRIHPNYDFIAATPDAITKFKDPSTKKWVRVVIDAKTVSSFQDEDKDGRELWGPEGTDRLPMDYYWQLIHHLSCFPTCHEARLIALEPSRWELREYIVRRRDASQAIRISDAQIADWWTRYVLPRKTGDRNGPIPIPSRQPRLGFPDAIAGSNRDGRATCETLYPRDDLDGILRDYIEQGELMRQAERARDEAKDKLLVIAQQAETVTIGEQVRYHAPSQGRRSIDQAALLEWLRKNGMGPTWEFPEEVYRTATWRQIRVPKPVAEELVPAKAKKRKTPNAETA